MRVAISGRDEKENLTLIKKFIKEWSGYASPSKTIYEELVPDEEKIAHLKEPNEIEKGLYAKLLLLDEQYKKYEKKEQIIYNGSPLDVLVYSLRLMEYGHVSDEFFEVIINQCKILMRSLDVIYILPTEDEDSLEGFEKDIENTYASVFDNYELHFEDSPLFDQEDCPGIFVLSEPNKIGTIKDLIGTDGEMASDGYDKELIDVEKMEKVLKGNRTLLDGYQKGVQKSAITLINP